MIHNTMQTYLNFYFYQFDLLLIESTSIEFVRGLIQSPPVGTFHSFPNVH